MPPLESRGLALEIKVGTIMYAGDHASTAANSPKAFKDKHGKKTTTKAKVVGEKSVKKIFFEDVSIYSDEFEFRKHSHSTSRSFRSTKESEGSGGGADDSRELEEEEDEGGVRRGSESESEEPLPEAPLQLASLVGKQELQVIVICHV